MNKHITTLALLFAAWPALADEAKLLAEARSLAVSIPPKLIEVLNEEIDKGGAANAISVCREKAPQMANAASEKSGWSIRRVSLKNRNPKAVPDTWERAALEDFEKRLAAGEKITALEKGETVSEDGKSYYRYVKALPTQKLCLQCHGSPEDVSAEVQAKLKELYPEDKAVGYGLNQIRGAMTLKKPL